MLLGSDDGMLLGSDDGMLLGTDDGMMLGSDDGPPMLVGMLVGKFDDALDGAALPVRHVEPPMDPPLLENMSV